MGTRETNSEPEREFPDKASNCPKKDSIIETALDEFSTAWINGQAPDPEQFCERFAEQAPELRKRIDDFLFVVEGLGSRTWSEEQEAHAASVCSSTQIVGSVLGDFRVLKEIGRGGMGVVYEAEQLSLNRLVALKVLSPHLGFNDEAVLKFRREAEAGGRQSHPGIVSVFAVGEHEGVHYIAQELVTGGRTLADSLREYRDEKERPLGYFRKIAKLLIEVADALSHAHSAGVIHRDVKPSNILIGPDRTPKVTDFGLAKIENALSLSRTGDLTGTPYYMSPEQAMSRRAIIDHRTDVYSLGVTLYEALTLEVPFDGESSQEVLKKVLDQEPRDPQRSSARVPRDLAVIALKAMEKEPGRRYATMTDFADDLRRYVAGEPILARPNSFLTKLIKKVKRNPAKSVAAVALVALVIFFSDSRWTKIELGNEKKLRKGLERIFRSMSALEHNPGLALGLAIEGREDAPSLFDKSFIISALLALHEIKTLPHDGPVASAAFSPDSKQIATASGQNIRIFNELTGEKLLPQDPCLDDVNLVRFSPDGEYLLIASKDGTARIWDAATGYERVVLRGHRNTVRSAEFSHDGQRVVTVSKDMTIRVWDASSGKELTSFIGHKWWPCMATFSPDGKKIVTASEDGTARVWREEEAGYTQEMVLEDHTGVVNAARFSPCGSLIVTASSDKTAIVWDIMTGSAQVKHTLVCEKGVNDVVFDPAGRRVAVATEGKIVRIHDVESGEEVGTLRGHDATVESVMFSNDGRMLVTASADGTARLWNDSPGQALIRFKADREGEHLKFSPDGSLITRISKDRKTIQVCDPMRDQEIRLLPHEKNVRPDAIFSPDGKRFVTATFHNTVKVWDVESETVCASFQLGGDVNSIDYLQDGREWILGCGDTFAVIWDATTDREVRTFEHEDMVHSAFFCKDGKTILTVEKTGRAQIWSISEKKRIKDFPTSLRINLVDFDREGDRTLLADYNGNVVIWDFESGIPWKIEIDSKEKISSIKFRPGRNEMLVNEHSGRAMIYDFSSDRLSGPCRHRGRVQSPVFSRNGSLLLTIPDEKTIAVRDLVDSNFKLKVALKKRVRQALFSRDDNGVIVAVEGGKVMLLSFEPLPIAQLATPRMLTPFEREEYYIGGAGGTGILPGSMPGGFRVRSGKFPASKPSGPRRRLHKNEFLSVDKLGNLYILCDGDHGPCCIKYDHSRGKKEKVFEFFAHEEIHNISIRPRGNQVFFCRKGKDDKYSYVVRDRDSGKEYVFSDGQESSIEVLSWHPTKNIVYYMKDENPDGFGGTTIMRLDVSAASDGKPQAILRRPGQYFNSLNISLDGKQACFIHYAGNSQTFEQEVWVADLDRSGALLSNPKQLTFDSHSDRDCFLSPDDLHVYWRGCEENEPFSIFRMNSDGTEKVTIFQAEPEADIFDMTVLSSGHIAYSTENDSKPVIEVIDVNGERVTTIPIDDPLLSLPVAYDRP